MKYVHLNHELIERQHARITIDDRGFRYGDSLFETIRVELDVAYQWDFHIQRLAQGLSALSISFDMNVLEGYRDELLKANATDRALLRIQISRGVGGRGYLPDKGGIPTLLIETLPMPPYWDKPVTLWLSARRKSSPQSLPTQYKTAAALGCILARMEADAQGCFDALMLSEAGELCEASSANLFWLMDDIWHTSTLATGALEGSTRAALLRLLGNVQEVAAPLEVLKHAQAVAICNAAWGVVCVTRLLPLDLSWDSEIHVARLRTLLHSDIERSCRG